MENPKLRDLQKEIDSIDPDSKFDCVVGFGGGSAMDASKAINLAISLPEKRRDLTDLIQRQDRSLSKFTRKLQGPRTLKL
jgi:alcohol dehydrogenase class IV